jgi:branched-chain amino acid transport system substrate-binding protein
MIRHRFGGHLWRRSSPTVRAVTRTAPPPASVTTRSRRPGAAHHQTTGHRAPGERFGGRSTGPDVSSTECRTGRHRSSAKTVPGPKPRPEEEHWMRFSRLAALTAATVIVVAACSGSASPSAKTIKIGVDLPLSGGETPNGEPTLNGIKLAVKEANANGGVAGYTIEVSVQDDAVNGVHDPQQGAKNVGTLAADPDVIGMVGPYNSNVGLAEIPVTNEAGLLQCSPANTNPSLTKPDYGALDVRKTNPTKINYVRVATTDDIQGPAGAQYAYNDLGKRNALIIDDTETFGKGVADAFEGEFKKLGGTVVDRVGAPKSTTDYTSILTAAKSKNPDVVYFGGVTTTGGGTLRKQMAQAGLGDLPYVGPDGIVDGSGATDGSFINIAGASAANSFGTIAAIHDIPNPTAFSDSYKKEYNKDPGAYSAPAYACTQIILAALGKVTATSDMAALRESIRAYVTGGNTFDTVLGTVGFDANGDTTQHIISFYSTDMTAAGGKGDWVFTKQQDFGN